MERQLPAGHLKSSDGRVLSVLTVYIICPCVIIDSFQIEFSQEKLHGLVVAFVAALVNMVIGILYGGIAGYAGGAVDAVMMRIVDIISTIPLTL